MFKKIFITTIVALTAAMAIPGALATTISFNLDIEFSGGQAPGGPAPWANLTFTDSGVGQVTATFTPLFTAGGTENISGWYFNVADAFAGNLILSPFTKGGTFDTPTFSQGLDAFKADGDGFYDALLDFTVGGNASKVFDDGDSLSFTITSSVSGLDATDFNVLSNDSGGHGPFFTAAHVQNTTGVGTGGSGWIAPGETNGVPEGGSTVMLLGAALTGLGLVRRFIKR